jgi:hypothetical protein
LFTRGSVESARYKPRTEWRARLSSAAVDSHGGCIAPSPRNFLHTSLTAGDKEIVNGQSSRDLFLENAAQIWEAAEARAQEGTDGADWDILIGHDGAIRMIADSDWSIDSLKAHHGARMAYRVRRQSTKVRLEGRAGSRTCLFEAVTPDGAARLLLASGVSRAYLTQEPAVAGLLS